MSRAIRFDLDALDCPIPSMILDILRLDFGLAGPDLGSENVEELIENTLLHGWMQMGGIQPVALAPMVMPRFFREAA